MKKQEKPFDPIQGDKTEETNKAKKFLKPLRQKGGLYFYSGVIMGKKNVFVTNEYINLMVNALKFAELKKDIKNLAYVIMPNHFYWLFKLSEKQDDPVAIYKDVKGQVAIEIMNNLKQEVKQEKPYELAELFKNNPRVGRSTPQKLLWTFAEYAKGLEGNRRFRVWLPKTPIRLIDSDELLQKKLATIKNAPLSDRWQFVQSSEQYPYMYLAEELAESGADELKLETFCPIISAAEPVKVTA